MPGIIQATISRAAAEHIDVRGLRARAKEKGIDDWVEINFAAADGCRITCTVETARLLVGELSAAADAASNAIVRQACALSANIVRDELERPHQPLMNMRGLPGG